MTQLPLIMLCTYVQIKVSWSKHSIVLNGLLCSIVRLFDSFVPRRSIIYFKEWGQTPMYSHIAVVAGVKKYRVPKIESIELCVKWYGRHQCFLSRSRFTPCLSMEGGLSVIMVMEDCQCSYTGLFDQVPGVIRNGRGISKPKPPVPPPYFHLSQSCMAQGCHFFFHQPPRQTWSRKALVWP